MLDALDPARPGARAVVLEGEPGVGKTALWRRALGAAPARGWRILTSAPARTESRLAFAALGDLFDLEIDEALAGLPTPQRRVLEVALLRSGERLSADAIDERMIGVATLAVLRALAARAPCVVAIDDLQWVDASSAGAIRFALRRLGNEPILVLATRRLGPRPSATPELERMLGDDRVQRLRVNPLSLGGVHELLVTRLGFEASRATLLRLHELTAGNPFYSLEIGRELIARRTEPAPDERLPVPGSVRELVRTRLERLSRPTREALLAAAALGRPTRATLTRLDPQAEGALDEALAAGVIEMSGGERVRFAHPLFASVHYEQAPLAERRRMHARLSQIVDDLEERARHLALATPGVDESVAAQLEAAAGSAARRGATRSAAEFSDLAARLTPTPSERAERVLAAAEYHHRTGSLGLAGDRARDALGAATAPGIRARAFALLGTLAADSEGVDAASGLYRRGLRAAGAARELRADLHQKLTWLRLLNADARGAERHARAMLRLAAGVDSEAEATASATLALVVVARGRPVPSALLERARRDAAAHTGDRPWAWSETSPASLEGLVLLWGGELERARGPLRTMEREAVESADPWREMHAVAYLSALETGLGRPLRGWELARRYVDLSVAAQDAQRAGALWPLAAAASWLGRADEARDAAREGLALAERTGHGLYVIGNLTALGATALSLEEPGDAAANLGRAWDLMRRGGIESVARFPVPADLVEALVAIGEEDRAAALAREHGVIATRLGRPWILALAARSAGLAAEARGEDEVAVEAFERALGEHDAQDRPLDRARTLLAYGAMERRRRRKLSARDLLGAALAAFEAAGAERWAERARAEIARIGGRQAAGSGSLSGTEAEIARLVAAGRTNREVAAALHLSARTVEWNLSKLYRKLGVRSRTELAGALGSWESLDAAPPSAGKSVDSPG
ncbi:MAG: AAA family ATPase [Solirubrobacterales bacterium]|nr:AAA family ATPase [Solirubrobacterales bacterium]MBV9806826.1 AAA family ATPase [Solirubrobacterales bacterium]